MLNSALTLRNIPRGRTIACKALVSAGLVALAVILPQLVHLALGQPGGMQWLPMYLPVLIGGCLLGSRWAAPVGILSPLVSYLITAALGDPMPAAARLPFMIAELAVFGAVSGLFSKKIAENGLWAFVAVIAAEITGRAVFLGLVAVLQPVVPFTTAMIWSQIKTGFIGLAAQAVIAPLVIIALRELLMRDKGND